MRLKNVLRTGLVGLVGFALLSMQINLWNLFVPTFDQHRRIKTESTRLIPDTYSAGAIRENQESAPMEIFLPGLYALDMEISVGSMVEPSSRAIGRPVADLSETDVLDKASDSTFNEFLQEVFTGDGQTITGVYVEGLFRLRVLQQPFRDVAYVSNENGTATQFRSPALYGVVGLLAHNFLSGRDFLSLLPGDEIRLVYGDGNFQRYRVIASADFERLTRSDVHSDFRDLQTQAILTSREIFDRFYRGNNYLTLQTCLEGEGYSDWGVRMVSAVPIDGES
jgi:hypothetical protein